VFIRAVRALRDLRRYASPVIVQNAEQVNIAANGGQQVNMQQQPKKCIKNKAAAHGSQMKVAK
jgi:hypothetical protein